VARVVTSKRKKKEIISVAGDAEQKRNYELVVIFDSGSAEEKIETKVDALKQSIADFGGEISSVEEWGRRKLAYPIKNATEGYYILTHCVMKPSQVADLEGRLRITEHVLRHMVIKSED